MCGCDTPPTAAAPSRTVRLRFAILVALGALGALMSYTSTTTPVQRQVFAALPSDVDGAIISSVSWRADECFEASSIAPTDVDRILFCYVGDCSKGRREVYQRLLQRDATVRYRTLNASLPSSACVVHRRGSWIDAATGEFLSLSTRALLKHAAALHDAFTTSPNPCTLDQWLGSDESCNNNNKGASLLTLTPHSVIAALYVASRGDANGTLPYMLFSGDSMTRQLFARIIQLVRDIPPPIIEHTSLGELTYVIRETGDELILRPRVWGVKKTKRPIPPTLGFVNLNDTWLVRLDFTWQASIGEYPTLLVEPHVRLRDSTRGVTKFLYPTPALHFHGSMYWDNRVPVESVTKRLDEIADVYLGVQDSSSVRRTSLFVILTTPALEVGIGHSGDNPGLNAMYSRRNDAVRAWTIRTARRVPGVSVLDMERLVVAVANRSEGTKSRRKDSMHFMCTADPKYPVPISLIRMDRSGCEDIVNAGVVSRLVPAFLLLARMRQSL